MNNHNLAMEPKTFKKQLRPLKKKKTLQRFYSNCNIDFIEKKLTKELAPLPLNDATPKSELPSRHLLLC